MAADQHSFVLQYASGTASHRLPRPREYYRNLYLPLQAYDNTASKALDYHHRLRLWLMSAYCLILITALYLYTSPSGPPLSSVGVDPWYSKLCSFPVLSHQNLCAEYDFSSSFDRFSRVLHIRQWECGFQQGIGSLGSSSECLTRAIRFPKATLAFYMVWRWRRKSTVSVHHRFYFFLTAFGELPALFSGLSIRTSIFPQSV